MGNAKKWSAVFLMIFGVLCLFSFAGAKELPSVPSLLNEQGEIDFTQSSGGEYWKELVDAVILSTGKEPSYHPKNLEGLTGNIEVVAAEGIPADLNYLQFFPKISELRIVGEFTSFEAVAFCKDLKRLTIVDTKEAVDLLPVARLSKLEALTVQNYSRPPLHLEEAIEKTKTLTGLYLSSEKNETPWVFRSEALAASAKKLEELSFLDSSLSLSDGKTFGKLQKVTQLYLGLASYGEEDFSALPPKLTLAYLKNMTDKDLAVVFQRLPKGLANIALEESTFGPAAAEGIERFAKLTAFFISGGAVTAEELSLPKGIISASVQEVENSAPLLAGFSVCSKMEVLMLNQVSVQDLSFLEKMKSLQYLVISDSGLEDLTEIAQCGKLVYLDLTQNKLEDLTPLKELKKLSILNLSQNSGITDISVLAEMEELRGLTVDDTVSGLYEMSIAENGAQLSITLNPTGAAATASAFNAAEGLQRTYIDSYGEWYSLSEGGSIHLFAPGFVYEKAELLEGAPVDETGNVQITNPQMDQLVRLAFSLSPEDAVTLEHLDQIQGVYLYELTGGEDADVSFLRAMRGLVTLHLEGSWREQLPEWSQAATEDLAACPSLQFLDLRLGRFRSADSLKGLEGKLLTLESIRIEDDPGLRDGVFLQGRERLADLALWRTAMEDLQFLSGLENLKSFECNTSATNVSAVTMLSNAYIIEVSGLKESEILTLLQRNGKSLYRLGLYRSDITETVALQLMNFPGISDLTLSNCNIVDLRFLKAFHRLNSLNLSESRCVDFSPVGEGTYGAMLELSGCGLENIDFLAKVKIETNEYSPYFRLALRNNPFTDAGPLKNLSAVADLDLAGTGVMDVSMLKGLKNLQYLYCNAGAEGADAFGAGVNVNAYAYPYSPEEAMEYKAYGTYAKAPDIDGFVLAADAPVADNILIFDDPLVERSVRSVLDMPGGEITLEMADHVFALDIVGENDSRQGVSLKALEGLRGLRELNLIGVTPVSYSEITRCTNLDWLSLEDVGNMEGLKELEGKLPAALTTFFGQNIELETADFMKGAQEMTFVNFTNVPLVSLDAFAGMETLSHLRLVETAVEDIEVIRTLPGLNSFILSNRPLSMEPIMERGGWEVLGLAEVTAQELAKALEGSEETLGLLMLFGTECTADMKPVFASLAQTTELELRGCTGDLSALEGMTRLENLFVTHMEQKVLDSLPHFPAVQNFRARGCTLENVHFISGWESLNSVVLSGSLCEDLTGLIPLPQLRALLLDDMNLEDVSFLSELQAQGEYMYLSLQGNPVSKIPQVRNFDNVSCNVTDTQVDLRDCADLENMYVYSD